MTSAPTGSIQKRNLAGADVISYYGLIKLSVTRVTNASSFNNFNKIVVEVPAESPPARTSNVRKLTGDSASARRAEEHGSNNVETL